MTIRETGLDLGNVRKCAKNTGEKEDCPSAERKGGTEGKALKKVEFAGKKLWECTGSRRKSKGTRGEAVEHGHTRKKSPGGGIGWFWGRG